MVPLLQAVATPKHLCSLVSALRRAVYTGK